MKISSLVFLFLLLSFFVDAQARLVDSTAKMPPHPRLLLLKGEENRIKQAIKNDKTWRKLHDAIIEECDSIINTVPVERIKIGVRLLDKSRECLRRVFYLSYAWRMTAAKKYLERGEKELLAVAAFSDWNPTHYLDVAEMTMAVAIGYDWLYDGLQENSRKIIRDALVQKGIETSFDTVNFNHKKKWLTVTNNWNQVCNAGLSYGALAIFENYPSLAANVINRSVESIAIPMKDAYGSDGAYPEGYVYWGYGTTFNVMFLDAVEKIFKTDFGLEKYKGFFETAYYLENMVGPSGKNFNYSDGGDKGAMQEAMYWFSDKLKDHSLLWVERNYLFNADTKKWVNDRLLPALMVWSKGVNLKNIPAPKPKIWVGNGKNPVALMRSSWTDKNTIYAGLKGGSPFVTHGHMDVGSFVLDAEAVRWAMDFGAQDYESLESKNIDLWDNVQNGKRWEIFRYNNFAHSTLTVNNRLQQVDGYAPVTSYSADSLFMNAVIDISSLYKGSLAKANRGIAIVNNQYLLIRDEVETLSEETTIRWSLLTDASVKIISGNKAELSKQGKKLQLIVKEPGAVLRTWSTDPPPHDYDAPNPGTVLVGFEVKIPAGSKSAFNVIMIPGKETTGAGNDIKPLREWSK